MERRLGQLRDDLLHIDHALRLFDPTIEVWDIRAKKPRIRNSGYFVHGEMSRHIYDALRSQETVSAAELTEMAIAAKMLPANDKHLRAAFISRFLVRLNQLAQKGMVERSGSGNGVRWKLAGEA